MKMHTSNTDTARVMSHRQNPLLAKSEWLRVNELCYDYGYTLHSALSEIVSLVCKSAVISSKELLVNFASNL